MGKIAELTERLERAKAREEYYKNRNITGENFNATVRPNPKMEVGYRSLLMKLSAEIHAPLRILASEASVKFFADAGGSIDSGLAELGLVKLIKTGDGSNYDSFVSSKGIIKAPTKAIASVGLSTPIADRTPWGTRYQRRTAKGTGSERVSYTAPISKVTGNFGFQDLVSIVAEMAASKADVLKTYGTIRIKAEEADDTLNPTSTAP